MITLLNERFTDNEDGAKIHFYYNGDPIYAQSLWVDCATGMTIIANNWELSEGYFYWIGIPPKFSNNLQDTKLIFNKNLGEFKIKLGGKSRPMFYCDEKLQIKYLSDDETFGTYYEVILSEIYNFGNVKIQPNDIVLDIGANYGLFSLYASSRSANKIYSFEPSIPVYNLLVENVSINNNIIPINKAVSEFDGYAEFNNTKTTACSYVSGTFPSDEQIISKSNVETININTIFSSYSLDFVDFAKIDCEGSELDIFLTITDENLNKINKFVIEYHTQSIGQFILSKLVKNGFKIESSNEISNNTGLIYAYKKN
jgi:FkbM family methyltransferase